MNNTSKLHLLKICGSIFEKSKHKLPDRLLFNELDNELNILAEHFNISKTRSFYLALFFAMNYENGQVDFRDLAQHFACNAVYVLEYYEDIEYLAETGFLKKQKEYRNFKSAADFDNQYTVSNMVAKSIIQNKTIENTDRKFASLLDVLEKVHELTDLKDEEELSTRDIFQETELIIKSNIHFTFLKKISQAKLKINDLYVYLYLVWRTITGHKSTDINFAVEDIFDKSVVKVKYVQSLLAEENDLIKNELIELEEAHFFNDTEMKLSLKSINLLKEEGIKIYANKKKKNNVLNPEKLKNKRLFYNGKEKKDISILSRSLQDINFKKIQKRLMLSKLSKGVTVLLYGKPGTGKTETVYQLAKQSKREIVKVEISQSKSMWFGESEKRIKRIFTDYKDYANDLDKSPILLFNEADAILSKRKNVGKSNVAQTENTIQNIILEELEDFEGIFFATTNLISNLDKAFERRFLFKIEFKYPENYVRSKIWRSKMPKLTKKQADELSGLFDFSGGQIDNIVRKCMMNEIIHGEIVTFKMIKYFCKSELLINKNLLQIGF